MGAKLRKLGICWRLQLYSSAVLFWSASFYPLQRVNESSFSCFKLRVSCVSLILAGLMQLPHLGQTSLCIIYSIFNLHLHPFLRSPSTFHPVLLQYIRSNEGIKCDSNIWKLSKDPTQILKSNEFPLQIWYNVGPPGYKLVYNPI